jgi:hypothetical protein
MGAGLFRMVRLVQASKWYGSRGAPAPLHHGNLESAGGAGCEKHMTIGDWSDAASSALDLHEPEITDVVVSLDSYTDDLRGLIYSNTTWLTAAATITIASLMVCNPSGNVIRPPASFLVPCNSARPTRLYPNQRQAKLSVRPRDRSRSPSAQGSSNAYKLFAIGNAYRCHQSRNDPQSV